MFHQGVIGFEWHDALLAILSFLICSAIVILQPRLARFGGRRQDLRAVQSMHKRPTPRVGGIAIFVALCVSIIFVPDQFLRRYSFFMIAVGLLFAVGLLEDLGFHVSPRKRLLAAAIASFLVVVFLDIWLPRMGVPLLDGLVARWAVGVPLTLLITAGVTNSFNLIDGVNGLAAATAIIAAIALGAISELAGYDDMVHFCTILAAAVFGFLVVNYPLGLIFLGDAGAYTLGFVLSWFGISILVHAPEVSPWAVLLTLFWPIADLILAIYRRLRRKAAAMAPDRLHMHQMVMRGLEICVVGRRHRGLANSLTTLVLTPFVIAPPMAGVIFWNNNFNAFTAVLMIGGIFGGVYTAGPVLIRHFRHSGWRRHSVQADLVESRSAK